MEGGSSWLCCLWERKRFGNVVCCGPKEQWGEARFLVVGEARYTVVGDDSDGCTSLTLRGKEGIRSWGHEVTILVTVESYVGGWYLWPQGPQSTVCHLPPPVPS